MANWLDKYEQGGLVLKKKTKDNYGKKENANEGHSTAGPGWIGEGTTNRGFDYNGAWGGQFQMGGSLPGSVGFMYARTQNPAPSNGKYAKKTQASAQNGQEMKYYQDGLDFKPKSISQDGGLFNIDTRAAQDATRNVIPRKMTAAEKKEAKASGDAARKRTAEKTKEILAERKRNISQKGDLSTPGSWHIEDKARLFPSSVGGAGEIFDEYINLATYVGVLADALGESIAEKDPKAIATSLALAAGTGALGIDPLGSALKVPGKVAQSMESGLLSNAWRLNPKAFKPTEGMMYRGIGKEGMEDALQSGLFRAKQNVTPTSIGNFNTTRQFSKAYYSPRFDIADQYGKGYIAEVPRGASDWGKRYGKKEWSQIAQRDIPITEGKVLQKDWLKRYKEVPKPTASEQVVRGPIPAPYKGTTLPYDNIGYKEPATGELAPYLTPEFETIPYSELPKTMYHGGPSVIADIDAIKTMREGLPIQSATSPTSRGFYTTPNTWMRMEGSPNPLREVEGFYDRNIAESAENYAMGRGDAYIHAGEINPEANIVDWKTFSNLEPVKGLSPDFRRLSPEAAKIAEDLGIHGIRDVSEYNILNPQKAFKSFKPAYKNLGKGWERYAKGGIVDPMGQWAHPGEVTTIPSNDITMEGVDYDVLGVSDTGDTKLMKPGKNYKFKGNSVTEYPKGGWLNKYK